jgi:hypothetical protein
VTPSPKKRKKLRSVRQWQLFLQLDENTRKASETEDIKFLKSIVKNKLGTHVYKQDGNLKGEYIARCKDCDDCTHLVKVGPGENNLFKIMIFGEHFGPSKERPKHGIAKCLLDRIDAAANLNTTTMLIRSSLEMDKSINRNLIPSTQQLNNRLSHLKRKSRNNNDNKSNNEILNVKKGRKIRKSSHDIDESDNDNNSMLSKNKNKKQKLSPQDQAVRDLLELSKEFESDQINRERQLLEEKIEDDKECKQKKINMKLYKESR